MADISQIMIDGVAYDVKDAVARADIETINNALDALQLSEDVKIALLNCFAHVTWTDENGQTYYNALESALYPTLSEES